MAGTRPSLRSKRLPGAGPDTAAQEVVAYIFMLGMGTIALIVTMNVMTEAQSESQDIAAGIQLKQAGEIAAAHIQDGSRVVGVAPDATFHIVFDIPEAIGQTSYTATLENQAASPGACTDNDWVLELRSDDNTTRANVTLGNAGRVAVDGNCLHFEIGSHTFHSSLGQVQLRYDPDPDPSTAPNPRPTFYFEKPTR